MQRQALRVGYCEPLRLNNIYGVGAKVGDGMKIKLLVRLDHRRIEGGCLRPVAGTWRERRIK